MDELKNLLNADVFLGRGWSFPPELTDSGVQISAYEQDIEEGLRILFSTPPCTPAYRQTVVTSLRPVQRITKR